MNKALLALVVAAMSLPAGSAHGSEESSSSSSSKASTIRSLRAIHQGCEKWNKEKRQFRPIIASTRDPASNLGRGGARPRIVQDMFGKPDTVAIAIPRLRTRHWIAKRDQGRQAQGAGS